MEMWKPYQFEEENINDIRDKFVVVNSGASDLLYKLFVNDFDTNEDAKSTKSVEVEPFVKFCEMKNEQETLKNDSFSESTISNSIDSNLVDKSQLNKLKDYLICVQKDVSQVDVMTKLLSDVFNTVNVKQVPMLCEFLELNKMDETVFHSNFCKPILQLNPPISFSVGVNLVYTVIYDRVMALNSPPSRLFISTILEWTNVFPKTILEGLILPCIQNNNLGKIQSDLMIKIIKESLPLDHTVICLRECLQRDDKIDETRLIILQELMAKKVHLEEDCLTLLFSTLLKVADHYKQNLTFSKLLLTIFTKQEHQISSSHLSILDKIVNRNETFLKKQIEKALQKLFDKYL